MDAGRQIHDDFIRRPSREPAAARRGSRAALALLVVAALILGLTRLATLRDDPEVALLMPEGGAEWIFFDMPFQLGIYRSTRWVVGFRKSFQVEQPPDEALLIVRGFRDATVRLDGRLLQEARRDPSRWKTPFALDLAQHLAPGEHELLIKVQQFDGPPGLLAHSRALGLVTDASWEATIDGGRHWSPVRTADALRMTEQRARALTGPQALSKIAPLLMAVAAGAIAVGAWRDRRARRSALPRRVLPAAWIRWGMLGAWLLLIANNLPKFPAGIGFDLSGHLAYIDVIRSEQRLPLASDGWEMFQSPLYHGIAAAWLALASRVLETPQLDGVLRLLSLLAGMAQVEIVYRTLRSVLPDRQDLQALGALLGSLLPMNLYMSHYVGNEPLAGALAAASIGLALAAMYGGDRCRAPRRMLLLGGVWGLALLAKVSAVLLAGPLAVWLVALGWQRGEPMARILGRLACVFGVASAVSGWYYARNWILLGTPFVGGWDPSRGIVWWQDPGYRTSHSFLSFGDSLVHPTAIHPMGFWDTLYATLWSDGFLGSTVIFDAPPPWSLAFLISGPLLALFPTALMIAGAARGVLRRDLPWRAAVWLAIGLVGIYLAALLELFLRAPFYCHAKASYTLGLVPVYALLFATGADPMMGSGPGRRVVFALVACWSLAAYLAYFVI